MKIIIISVFIVLSMPIYPQSDDSLSADLYGKGMLALSLNKPKEASIYFEKALYYKENFATLYELAKLNAAYNTIAGREAARKYLRSAIWLDPNNLECRFLYASLQEYFGRSMAFKEYEKIMEIDPECVEAWYNLGRLKEEDYYEYHHSVFREGDSPELSYDKFAKMDYEEAEKYFLQTLRLDPQNKEANMRLSFLYEEAGFPEKAIPYMEKAAQNDSSADADLYLGMLYYENRQFQEAFNKYYNALKVMSDNEYADFSYNSVIKLLEPIIGDIIARNTREENINLIDAYWKTGDPLILTGYNERILEHYSRVAYANLRFGNPKKNITGWKTDKGEALLRYGEPVSKTRYRPHMNAGGDTQIFMKTDVWNYGAFKLGFDDKYMSGNYRFVAPEVSSYIPQFGESTHDFMNYLRKARYEIYNPKYEGPAFKTPYVIAQFKNKEEKIGGFTDVYAAYGLEVPDSLYQNKIYGVSHTAGFFFFNYNYQEIADVRSTANKFLPNEIILPDGNKKYSISSIRFTAYPDSGKLAFEIIRDNDKGVFTSHEMFTVRKFSRDNLDISDILLVSKAEVAAKDSAPLNRNGINILPNPTGIFGGEDDLFLYFEIYNLALNSDGRSRYEQKITILPEGYSTGFSLKNTFNSVAEFLGLKDGAQIIRLVSENTGAERDPSIYLQLDISSYRPGNYDILVEIKDILSGRAASAKVEIIKR